MDEPIYRAGTWWTQRDDGRWLYWNIRGDSWDHHPYGPPLVRKPAPAGAGARHAPPLPAAAPTPHEPHQSPPGPPPPYGYGNGASMPTAPPYEPPGPHPPEPPSSQPPPIPPPPYDPPSPYGTLPPPKPKPAPEWAAGTPVVFAQWWQRMLAFIVDQFVVWGPTLLVLTIVDAAVVPGSMDPFANEIDSTARGVALLAAFSVCYFVFFSAYFALANGGERGATVGKRLLRIRVADQYDGSRIGPGRAFLRWILIGVFWLIAYVPGLLNFLWPLWDPQKQSWHDKLSNSVVVTVPR